MTTNVRILWGFIRGRYDGVVLMWYVAGRAIYVALGRYGASRFRAWTVRVR